MKTVKLDRKAEKELAGIFRGNKTAYHHIRQALQALASNPFSGKALAGDKKGGFRARVGDYRIIYEITTDEVWVIKIAHRKDVYR